MTDHLRRTTLLPATPGWLRYFLFLLLAGITALPLSAAPRPDIKGRVVSVHDGDTLTLLTPEKKHLKIRLEGIDAPELKQAFGTKAKATLSALVFNKDVVVKDKGTDRYRRTLGRISCGKLDVNLAMVQRGIGLSVYAHLSEKITSREIMPISGSMMSLPLRACGTTTAPGASRGRSIPRPVFSQRADSSSLQVQ